MSSTKQSVMFWAVVFLATGAVPAAYSVGAQQGDTKPEPAMKCEVVDKFDGNHMRRCTDTQREATCYIFDPGARGGSISCVPNQWLNMPNSLANVNDKIAE